MKTIKFEKEQINEFNLNDVVFDDEFVFETHQFAARSKRPQIKDNMIVLNFMGLYFEIDFICNQVFLWKEGLMLYCAEINAITIYENEYCGTLSRIKLELVKEDIK